MKRKPGVEEERMIPIYEENLKQKDRQMQAMEQELSMYSTHLQEYKLEIDRLNKVFQNLFKYRIYKILKKDSLNKRKENNNKKI